MSLIGVLEPTMCIVREHLKVGRVHAASIATDVVQIVPGERLAHEQFVGDSMGT